MSDLREDLQKLFKAVGQLCDQAQDSTTSAVKESKEGSD